MVHGEECFFARFRVDCDDEKVADFIRGLFFMGV
jgi:hypothetical protein